MREYILTFLIGHFLVHGIEIGFGFTREGLKVHQDRE